MKIIYSTAKEEDAPELSVIIPFKNEGPTLPVTLDSLARQDPGLDFEVIFVDGCSDDESIEVIRKHPLSHEVPIIIGTMPQGNHGQMISTNRGADVARADLLLLMQADVKVTDTHALVKIVRAFDDPETVGTFFIGRGAGEDFRHYDFWGQVFMARYQGSYVPRDFDTKFNGVRKSTFFDIGGFDEIKQPVAGGDFDFEMRLREKGHIAATDIEAWHLHGFNQAFRPSGMLKKYARNGEAAGVTAPIIFHHLDAQPGLRNLLLQQAAVSVICLSSIIPWLWPWTPGLVFLLGFYWNRFAYKHIRSWKLVYIPFFSFAAIYAFTFFFLMGLVTGKTRFQFSNKMK